METLNDRAWNQIEKKRKEIGLKRRDVLGGRSKGNFSCDLIERYAKTLGTTGIELMELTVEKPMTKEQAYLVVETDLGLNKGELEELSRLNQLIQFYASINRKKEETIWKK